MPEAVRPRAEIQLADSVARVTGENLETRRLRLFFRGVLGCQFEDGVWVCPTRGVVGTDLVVRIARRLESEGFEPVAEGADADLALKHEVERVRSYGRTVEAVQHLLSSETSPVDEAAAIATLEDFGWNTAARPLLPHQRQGLVHALTAINAANFSVPGSGKTATALSVIATHLAHNNIDAVLVIGPLSAFRPWEREALAALPRRLRVRRVRGGSRASRAEIYRRVKQGDLLLLSFATATSDQAELERLCRHRRILLVVDESHRVKRFRGGQWAPALVRIARYARVRLILTGTPMPQSPLDLWSQFTILWPGGELAGSRATFAARATDNFGSLISHLEPFFVRTPKSALGLPPARVIQHDIELAPLQRDVYDLIFTRLRRAIPDAAAWTDKIDALRRARPIRLLQAASNPDLLNETDGFFRLPPIEHVGGTLMNRLHRYREVGELPAKFSFALEFLRQLQAENRKCVVWTSFIRNIDQFTALIHSQLGAPCYSVDGRVPAADVTDERASEEIDETREQRIDRFLAEPGFAVLVANPAACAESISLHSNCHVALYLDRTHDCARWLQSIDRIHRLGLPEGVAVEIHVLRSALDGATTIDHLVDQSLQRKSGLMELLLEGAELREIPLGDADTLDAAEGSREDLETVLRYLLGEA